MKKNIIFSILTIILVMFLIPSVNAQSVYYFSGAGSNVSVTCGNHTNAGTAVSYPAGTNNGSQLCYDNLAIFSDEETEGYCATSIANAANCDGGLTGLPVNQFNYTLFGVNAENVTGLNFSYSDGSAWISFAAVFSVCFYNQSGAKWDNCERGTTPDSNAHMWNRTIVASVSNYFVDNGANTNIVIAINMTHDGQRPDYINLTVTTGAKPEVVLNNGTNNVTLRFPTNATTNATSRVINFTYNVSASSTVLGCELWNNETSWGTKIGNQTRIDNNLTNWINYTFATDSTYLWNVLCNTSDGNLNFSVKNFSITINTLNNGTNNITLKVPLNATWNNTRNINFTFNASASADILSCELWSNETSWGTKTGNQTRITNNATNWINNSFNSDGNYLWNVLCNTSDGNLNFSVKNYTIYVDASIPEINFTTPINTNRSFVNRNWVFVNVSTTELNIHTYRIHFDAVNYTTPDVTLGSNGDTTQFFYRNFTALSDGNHSFYGWVNDSVSGNNRTENRTITIDTTIPKVNFSSPTDANDTYSNRNWTLVNVSITEVNVDTYRIFFDGTNYTTPDVTIISNGDGTQSFYRNFTNLGSGNHSFYGWINDSSGWSNQTSNQTILLNQPPTITINFPPNLYALNRNITFNYSITDADGDSLNCSLMFNSTFQSTNASVKQGLSYNITSVVDNNVNADFLATINCTDRINSTNSSSLTVRIDTINPLITTTYPSQSNNKTGNSSNFTFDISATDNNLLQFEINITNSSRTQDIYYKLFDQINTTSQSSNAKINFTYEDRFNVLLASADDHTAQSIDDYEVSKDLAGLKLVFNMTEQKSGRSNNMGIKLKSSDIPLKDFGYVKSPSNNSYQFWFDFNGTEDGTVRAFTFKVSAVEYLVYRANSSYMGHFVSGLNWITFSLANGGNGVWTITPNPQGKNEYEVKVQTTRVLLNFTE